MATTAQVNNFISKLSALAIAEAKKRNKWVLPSVCIAQAALETGWGTSSLMIKANAYFGIKATGWKGKVYNSATLECYDGRTYTNVNACFRAYDSPEASVKDYFDLITGSARYSAAVNVKDAKQAITAIKNGGYATDPTYIDKVMNIINSYNLTKYDNEIIGKTNSKEEKTVNIELKELSKGSKGEQVKTVQRILAYMGYSASSIDGDFGAKTDAGVRSYQKANKLSVDGVVGVKTWTKLLKG